MEKETFYLICFESSQKALYLEKQISKQFPGVRLVPIPPEISACCGLGLKICVEDFDKIKKGVWEEDIYIVEKQGGKRDVRKWEKV